MHALIVEHGIDEDEVVALDAKIPIRAMLGVKVGGLRANTRSRSSSARRRSRSRMLRRAGRRSWPSVGSPWVARTGAARDPDDWPIAAAAPIFDCPIWTEDKDVLGAGIPTWTSDLAEIYLRDDEPESVTA